jgi:hypothetical protein
MTHIQRAVVIAFSLALCVPALSQGSEDAPKGEPIGAPIGAPIGGAPQSAQPVQPGAPGQPTRVIPQSSWDMLNKLEQGGGDEFVLSHDGKHIKVTFGALSSYEYEVADPAKLRDAKDPSKLLGDQIPAKIRDLEGKGVLIVGFMVPIDVDRRGNVTSFALTQNQSFCCYGIPPGLTELVVVDMAEGKSAPYSYDVPVAVYGTMTVGEEIDDGYILSLYRIVSDEVIDIRELMRRVEKTQAATD